MGTLKLSNRTASLLICLLLQGGVFAGKLGNIEHGLEGTEQPSEATISLQKSYHTNDAKDGEAAATPQLPAAGEKVPAPHPVGAGPGNPAAVAPLASGPANEEAKKPNAAHHLGSATAQRPAPEPPAGPSAAVQDTLEQQQGNPPPQAEAAPDTPDGNQAPAKHASASPQGTVKAKPSLRPGVSQKSPSAVQVGGLGQALGAGKAPGNDPVDDASPVNPGASGDKVNNKANLPATPSPTSAPTTKPTKPTPATTVAPSRPSQVKELLNTKPTDMLLDVPKDSGGVPPPSPGGLSSDYSHAREPDSEEELEPLAPKEPSPMLSGAASVGAQPVAAGDSRPEKPLDASGAAGSVSFPPAQDDSHFFAYFLTAVVLCVVGYLAFHNKRKILALILEGRHERQRRHNGHYRRLDSVDDTSSSRKGRGSF